MSRIRKTLYGLYRGLARLLVPGLENSQFAYARTLPRHLPDVGKWLDLGCGRALFPPWMTLPEEVARALEECRAARTGIDFDLPSLRDNRTISDLVRGDVERLPFRDGSFDLVTANMVVEHVADPRSLLAEVRRTLRPGGRFLFHTPNLASPLVRLAGALPQGWKNRLIRYLEDREEEDIFPTVYRLNTAERIRDAGSACDLEVVEILHVDSTPSTVMLGPLVVFELLWIRLLRVSRLAGLRTNLVATMRRPSGAGESTEDGGDLEGAR
jgi:SAM-dependent methyltransferase